ncbi:MAG: chemotaxis protein CheW [Verrucomicrobiota bacterium]
MLFLLFQIGHDRYALEARRAVEVIPLLGLKTIPQAPRGVAGIFNYRGQPVPALDLSELTVGRPAQARLSTRIIVVRNVTSDMGQVAGKGDPALSPDTCHLSRAPLLGIIAEHATEMIRRDERDFVDSGVKVGAALYLGPVLMDGKGVIQLLHTQHLLGEGVRELLFSETAPAVLAPVAAGS